MRNANESWALQGRSCTVANYARFAPPRRRFLDRAGKWAARLPDSELLNRAAALGRILFSLDDDLIAEAVRPQRKGEQFATVVYARQMDISIGRAVGDLEAIAKSATPDDAQGQIIFL